MNVPASNNWKSFLTAILWPEESDSLLKRTSGNLLPSLRCSEKEITASLHWIKQKSVDTIICKFDSHLGDTKGI